MAEFDRTPSIMPENEKDESDQKVLEGSSPLGEVIRRLRRNHSAVVGFGIIVILVIVALFAPVISPEDPNAVNRARMNEVPRWLSVPDYRQNVSKNRSLLGRDVRGRDVLSRVLYGARTSLLVGIAVVTLASLIGVLLGGVAGYCGGFIDSGIMRVVDILLAFPFLILALAVVSVIPQPGLWNIALVLGLTSWPSICRLTRGQVLQVRELEYVKAASVLGAGHVGILFRHVLPNCLAPVIIWYAMGIAGAIMGEASLSFLGLGDPDSLSWGTMIFLGLSRSNFPVEWWAATFPAIALALTVLGFNLLGDGVQDALNPGLKD